jgi:carbamoyltransferase
LQIGAESIPLICLLLANGTSVTAILGISAYFHDSAAALVVDGEIVAAAQEERFTRIKHDPAFPRHAVDYCLAEAGLTPGQLDFVGFYDKPLLKFERLLETCVAFAPRGFRAFAKAMPLWVKQKLHLSRDLHAGMGGQYRKRIVFPEHHESHAASAFFPSPFEEAAILTIDGVGEWATASYGVGRGHRIELLGELRFPHSLGMLYSAFTYFCGFRVNSGEYKLMGLAPYGTPRYVDAIRRELVTIREDGSLRLNLKYFDYCIGDRMTSPEFDRLFGGPPRQPESPLTEREMDLAASIQVVTEEIMLKMARHVHAQTGLPNLCLAGGVALNCVGNGRLLREGPFENLWIQPAAGDAGGALGVATFIWHQLLDQPRVPRPRDSQSGSLLGPALDDDQIEKFLNRVQARYRRFPDDSSLCEEVSRLLSEDKVVGWVQGRMEFGPRALGARSILGDARSPRMQSVMNLKIKFRESFRPFAPSVLEDHVAEHFEVRPRESSPYMLLVAGVRDARRADAESQMAGLSGIDKLKVLRSEIPAVTHVDYSARIQTVDPERHGRYHALIEAFKRRTGCPVIINTSFNVRGEPIVCTPEDAYRCFLGTNMDALVLEHCVLLKEEQAAVDGDKVREYLDQFKLD